MKIPTDLFTPIFAIARVAGWLAHLLEQLHNNRIFRPSQIWTGNAIDRDFIPIRTGASRVARACPQCPRVAGSR